jgi:hypothetical protein
MPRDLLRLVRLLEARDLLLRQLQVHGLCTARQHMALPPAQGTHR